MNIKTKIAVIAILTTILLPLGAMAVAQDQQAQIQALVNQLKQIQVSLGSLPGGQLSVPQNTTQPTPVIVPMPTITTPVTITPAPANDLVLALQQQVSLLQQQMSQLQQQVSQIMQKLQMPAQPQVPVLVPQQPIQLPQPTPVLQPLTNSLSPQQNGAPMPPDCTGLTKTSSSLPRDCQVWFGLIPFVQAPASCNGHMPTDLNLPADCASFNISQGVIPPSECMGKKPTDANLPQSCINFFNKFNIIAPPTNQSTTNQPGQNQTNYNSNLSPQQNGATPPPSCVGKTATTPNLPQECQIYFGLMSQPAQSQPPQQPINQQPPTSCMNHMPTDSNLPNDCTTWNTSHGIIPPSNCMGTTANGQVLSSTPQSCKDWINTPHGTMSPQPSSILDGLTNLLYSMAGALANMPQ